MDLVGEIPLPRGWDVTFGKELASSAIMELAPDYTIALSQPMSLQVRSMHIIIIYRFICFLNSMCGFNMHICI